MDRESIAVKIERGRIVVKGEIIGGSEAEVVIIFIKKVVMCVTDAGEIVIEGRVDGDFREIDEFNTVGMRVGLQFASERTTAKVERMRMKWMRREIIRLKDTK